MNFNADFIKEALFAAIRYASAPLVIWLVAHFNVTADNANAFIAGGATYLVAFIWSLFNKYRAEKKIVTALELPAGSSKETLRDVVASK